LYYNSSTNEITYPSSTVNDKTDIENLPVDTSVIYSLTPRQFTYIPDGATGCVGFIAQEVDLVDTNFSKKQDGLPYNINWDSITTYLVNEIQKLNKRIKVLEEQQQQTSSISL
jgi:hypothetical protein